MVCKILERLEVYLCKRQVPRKNKWKKINNKIYYFDKNGYMQTGWKKYKNSWYYLRKSGKNKGALCTGWKTISGKRYFLAKKTGARVTGWHTIKNTLYYFNNKGVLQKGKTVGEYQLDKITGAAIKIATEPDTSEVTDESNTTGGDADNTATTVDKLHIFVGDSRTVGLSNAMGCVSYDKLLQIRTEENLTEYYLAEVGSGYSWYSTKALPKLVKMLNENPAATVILNHGINDLGNIDQYIASYQWLIRVYPNTKFVIIIVVCVCVILGGYYYLTNRNNAKEEENITLTEIQELTTKNLDKNFPATPREVVKLYNRIITCFYNDEYTDDELYDLGDQARKLFDDELLENNPRDEYLRI